MTNRRDKLVVFALLVALALVSFWRGFDAPALPMDEGMLLVCPELLLKGQLPYRDFHLTKGPGNLAILSAAYAVFGANIFAERAVGLTYRLIILLAIFGIAQRWGAIVAAGCVFTSALFLANTDLMAHTWIAAAAFALCSLWMLANVDSAWRSFSGGVFAGMALLCRLDLGAALILSSLPLFLSLQPMRKRMFLVGAAVALAPFVFLSIVTGPSQVVRSLLVFPIFHLFPDRYMPITSAKGDVVCLFGWQLIASVVNVAAAIMTLRAQSGRQLGRLLLSVALFGFALAFYALERADSIHAPLAGFISISFLPLSIFVLLSSSASMLPRSFRPVLAILIVILGLQLTLPVFTRYFYRNLRVSVGLSPARQASKIGEELEPGDKGIFIKRNGRSFPFMTTQTAQDADDILAELERVSSPGQRLFVGPGDLRFTEYCDTYVYHMLPQLVPATYFLEMSPASAKTPDSRLTRDVESADWLLLNRTWDLMNEENPSPEIGPGETNRAVTEKFDLWLEHGPYLLLRKKTLHNSVMPPPAS